MLTITFHGLCGFTRQETGEELVLMPDAAGNGMGVPVHRAVLVAKVDNEVLDNTKTTWMPDELLNTPDGGQWGKWDLSGLELSSGGGTVTNWVPMHRLIDLSQLHPGVPAAHLKSGASILLKGGTLSEHIAYPNQLELRSRTQNVTARTYIEIIQWQSADLVIAKKSGDRITFRKDATVTLTNAAPTFGPGHGGLGHFAGYYTTIGVPANEQLALTAGQTSAPHGGAAGGGHVHTMSVGGGNCVPNVRLP
ncbi:MAG: hypothetical protein IPL75_07040 [Acidobacteria bacterium]|nr:hypothetical protein [Acidobacteriota bacterium]